MVNLREAFVLLGIRDSDCVWIRNRRESRISRKAFTGAEVRKRLDMRAIKVHHIDRVVDMYDGEFFGYELEVTGFQKWGAKRG